MPIKKKPAMATPRKAPLKKAVVTTTQVNPALLKEAKKRAGGDITRLQIVNATTVIVWNSHGQRIKVGG